MTNAFIAGVAGEALSPAEKSFFRSATPAGLILFSRNCVSHEQIRRLVGDVREAVGGDQLLVLIDQKRAVADLADIVRRHTPAPS